MRRLKSSFALAVTLVFSLGSVALFAQTENQEQGREQTGSQAQSDPAPVASKEKNAEPKPAEPKKAQLAKADTDVKSPADTSPEDTAKKADPPKGDSAKTPAPVAPTKPGRFALTFDDLKFDMEKTETFDRAMLTPEINSYHGGKVKIRGYIRPNFKQSGITKFIFVRDNKECCFGPQAAIFDNILVRLEKGASTNFTVRPVTVEGNFVLKEYLGDDGNVWSLYRMYNAKIK